MHCSANVGDKDDTAIFFGLSGTGKQLYQQIQKKKIGDDEHGWTSENTVLILKEDAAKVINLSEESGYEFYQKNVVFKKGQMKLT
jgi:phosphoenolpyruvate carboxykinase (ATP)